MAKRYRYAFVRKKEAGKGKLAIGLAVSSVLLFLIAVAVVYILEGQYPFIAGGICLFAAILSVYGFVMGLMSFSETGRLHRTSIVGSIFNGVLMVAWLGFFMMGVA